MKAILTLAAAALFASAANATVTNVTFNGFCDGMQLTTGDGVNFTSTQTGACLQGTLVTGSGRVINGHTLVVTVVWRPFTRTADRKRYALRYPLRTGLRFTEHTRQNGQWVLLNTGKYTVH